MSRLTLAVLTVLLPPTAAADASRVATLVRAGCGRALAHVTGTIEHANPALGRLDDLKFLEAVLDRRSYRYRANPDLSLRSATTGQDYPSDVIHQVEPLYHRTLRRCPRGFIETLERTTGPSVHGRATPHAEYLRRLGQRYQVGTCVHRADGRRVGLIHAWTERGRPDDPTQLIRRERVYMSSAEDEWHFVRESRNLVWR